MKKILITGASQGIGLELARLLAREGNQLMLVARNKEKLEKEVADLPGKHHQWIAADLSRKEDVHAVADHISKNDYDVLINNAGIGLYGRFEEMSVPEQAAMLHLNIYGLTILSHAFIKNGKNGDALVNISSTLGTTSFPGLSVYSATKAYVTNFSESLWWENKNRGIYVLGFCPGVTNTGFHRSSGDAEDLYPKFIIQTPEAVARELLHALKKRSKPRVVSGTMNRFMLFFQRFLSRKIVVNMMGSFSPVQKKPGNPATATTAAQ